MPVLSKEQILAVRDLAVEDIDMPEWGGPVRIQQLTMFDLERLTAAAGDSTRRMMNAIALSLVDDAGVPLFGLEEVESLAKHNVAPLKRLAEAVSKLNGWDKAIEAAEKNSASAPTGASSSA